VYRLLVPATVILAEVLMMDSLALGLVLRRRAVETVHESTEMLKQAVVLLKAGQRRQAERLQEAARAKRNESVWLMRRANKLDRDS
jgi:hypothetical protein